MASHSKEPFSGMGVDVNALPALKRPRRGGSGSGKSFVACVQTPVVPPKPDGRACLACGEKDDSEDPVDKALNIVDELIGRPGYRMWAYKPLADGRTSGNHCGYCARVFTGRYQFKKVDPSSASSKLHTMASVIALIGSDQREHRLFTSFVKKVIEYFIQQGGRENVRLPWEKFEQQILSMLEEFEVRWQDPEDAVWPLDLYIKEFGDPLSNGKNHTKTTAPDGSDVVLVPEKLGKLVRS